MIAHPGLTVVGTLGMPARGAGSYSHKSYQNYLLRGVTVFGVLVLLISFMLYNFYNVYEAYRRYLPIVIC